MDLIYMNSNREDVGVMKDFTFDLAFGKDENDFECKISRNRHCCEGGFFLYMEGTEYGGIIDDIETDTDSDEVIYHGRTWHGFLDSKCILPLKSGETSTSDVNLKLVDSHGDSYVDKYLIVSGEANKVLAFLIERLDLGSLFSASTDNSGITIKNFKFDRYTMAYSGIAKMLKSSGAKLKLSFMEGKVVLHAKAVVDYSKDEQFDSDLINIRIKNYYSPVNHVICLGKGELNEREVIHIYADSNGEISRIQSITGIQEVTDIYDNSNAESTEELENGGMKIIRDSWNHNSIKTDFDSDSNSFDIGDIVGAKDNLTGMEGKAEITKKIVTIKDKETIISYKVGEV